MTRQPIFYLIFLLLAPFAFALSPSLSEEPWGTYNVNIKTGKSYSKNVTTRWNSGTASNPIPQYDNAFVDIASIEIIRDDSGLKRLDGVGSQKLIYQAGDQPGIDIIEIRGSSLASLNSNGLLNLHNFPVSVTYRIKFTVSESSSGSDGSSSSGSSSSTSTNSTSRNQWQGGEQWGAPSGANRQRRRSSGGGLLPFQGLRPQFSLRRRRLFAEGMKMVDSKRSWSKLHPWE